MIPILRVHPSICEALRKATRTSGEVMAKFSLSLPTSDVVKLKFQISFKDARFVKFLENFGPLASQFGSNLEVAFSFFPPEHPGPNFDISEVQKIFDCIPGHAKFPVFHSLNKECLISDYPHQCIKDSVRKQGAKVTDTFDLCRSIYAARHDDLTPKVDPGKGKIMINETEYKKDLKVDQLFSSICESFASSPDNCLFVHNKFVANPNYSNFADQARSNKVGAWIVSGVVVVLMLFIVGIVMGFTCTKIYNNVLNERVSSIVRETVTDYQRIRFNEPSINTD